MYLAGSHSVCHCIMSYTKGSCALWVAEYAYTLDIWPLNPASQSVRLKTTKKKGEDENKYGGKYTH